MNQQMPAASSSWVLTERKGPLGLITLNRPEAMNALSLGMIRTLTDTLLAWRQDPGVSAVVVRGAVREGRSVAFCAGGDIRFFHQAALAGDPRLEDFFTEEYRLNHLIHNYPKPYVAVMDGVVMGGGMGISQGAGVRVVTERSQLAMPETQIGLFPDVGGGHFLSRCPGRIGEFLALTGQVLGAADALDLGLADVFVPSSRLPELVDAVLDQPIDHEAQVHAAVASLQHTPPAAQLLPAHRAAIDAHFSQPTLAAIAASLQSDAANAWAQQVLAKLRACSPLMLAVALEQVRRARHLTLEEDLRMERDLIRHSFALRPGAAGEAAEGVRALAIDKDRAPKWNPSRIEDVEPGMVAAFFDSPWPAHSHPLRDFLD